MKAMIFSAGLGTRFKPWTDKHPKALALVNGVSLLERNVRYLQSFGITDVVVNIHHFPEQIVDAIKEHDGWGSNVMLSDETGEVLETGGGLLKAQSLFTPGEDFVTINVDILCDLDLDALITHHEQRKALITLAVSDRSSSRCFVFDQSNRLIGWRNLQTGEERMAGVAAEPPAAPLPESALNKAFSGISVFNYDFFRKVRHTGKFSLVDAFLDLAGDELIIGFNQGPVNWVDVGRPESVAVAESLFA